MTAYYAAEPPDHDPAGPGQQGPGDRVEEEVVARRDDHQRGQQGIGDHQGAQRPARLIGQFAGDIHDHLGDLDPCAFITSRP
jgi:hypothetical protein